MLTHDPGEEGWCTMGPEGDWLMCMRCTGAYWVDMLRLSGDVGAMPLVGVLESGAFPVVVPGEREHILLLRLGPTTIEGTPRDCLASGRWELYAEAGKPLKLQLPADYVPIQAAPCVARDRFAVWMVGPIPKKVDPEHPPKVECTIFVVDIRGREVGEGEDAETVARKVAGWSVSANEDLEAGLGIMQAEAPAVLAFSADGKRLIATVAHDEKSGRTDFIEIDPDGKAPMKTLFGDTKAWQPGFSPDASTVVYLRPCPDDEAWRELVVRRLGDAKSTVVARLPGAMGEADTRWRWEPNGDLMAYHLSNDGVHIARVVPALKAAVVRHLSRERLRVARALAQLEFAVERFEADAQVGDLPGDAQKQLDALLKRFEEVDGGPFEEALEKARKWEKVESMPDKTEMAPVSKALKRQADIREERLRQRFHFKGLQKLHEQTAPDKKK
jgi:hypothetical protein